MANEGKQTKSRLARGEGEGDGTGGDGTKGEKGTLASSAAEGALPWA